MQPAYSVIFFTTASGAGFGLLFWLCLLGGVGHLPAQFELGLAGFIIGFGLAVGGLLSSTFHLGHPERAWRAFSQWRSSWLSREGVAAVATFGPTGLAALAWVFGFGMNGFWAAMAVLGSLLCLLTLFCTGQIYASLKAIPRWHHPAVTPVYVVLGLLSGTLLLNMLMAFWPSIVAPLQLKLTMFMILAAAYTKFGYWMSLNRSETDSTVATATGLGSASAEGGGSVRLVDPPHVQSNYLQKEMGFQVGRKHAERLRWIAILCLFIFPLVFLTGQMATFGSLSGAVFAVLAVAVTAVGLLVERWLFFAEAQHKVSLYYGADAV
jgi:DMSO reductase anchor subunit